MPREMPEMQPIDRALEAPSAHAEAAFVRERQRAWDELDAALQATRRRGLREVPHEQIARFSPLYRDVCADLSRAQAAARSGPLIDYLQGLTAAAHAVLYGGPLQAQARAGSTRGSTLRLALEAFPRAVRRHKLAMVLAFLLFFVPFFGGLFASLSSATFAARVVPEAQLRPLVEAYRQGFGAARGAGLDAEMAGFYVDNNVGIALRCFATGLAFGLGSAFYLVENGLTTGAIVGYVVAHGAGGNIFTFVVGHSSLELGAIVLAGGAGLALGWSIVSPGELTRVASLQRAARSVVTVVFGAAAMLLVAAAVEGFWSASAVSATVKRVVGAGLLAVVVAYIGLAGRGGDGHDRDPRWT
jgi:uncharacterized membrane protein SpoIIM required for sporulation